MSNFHKVYTKMFVLKLSDFFFRKRDKSPNFLGKNSQKIQNIEFSVNFDPFYYGQKKIIWEDSICSSENFDINFLEI